MTPRARLRLLISDLATCPAACRERVQREIDEVEREIAAAKPDGRYSFVAAAYDNKLIEPTRRVVA